MSKSPKKSGLAPTRPKLAEEHVQTSTTVPVERVQLGVRMEKRMVKVLKAIAEGAETSLGELLEDIVLHAFEGVSTFSDPQVQQDIKDFKRLYGMNYDVHDGYRFADPPETSA